MLAEISIVVGLVAFVATAAPTSVSLLKSSGPVHTSLGIPLYVGPVQYDRELIGPFNIPPTHHDSPPPTGYWDVVQWSNPFSFTNSTSRIVTPPDAACTSEKLAYRGMWSLQNPSTRICASVAEDNSSIFSPGAAVVQLAQNGDAVPCGTEFDLFLQPIGGDYPGYPRNTQPLLLNESVVGMALQLSAALEYVAVQPRCATPPTQCTSPSPDYAYGTIGLPLSNAVSRETIFFQIGLFDTRCLHVDAATCGCARYDTCDNVTALNGAWYFDTLPTLGVNYASSYFQNQPCLSGGDSVAHFRFGDDLLATLLHSISVAAERYGADGDPSHWAVGGLYVGTGLQGSAQTVLSISNISWTVTLSS